MPVDHLESRMITISIPVEGNQDLILARNLASLKTSFPMSAINGKSLAEPTRFSEISSGDSGVTDYSIAKCDVPEESHRI